MSDHSHEQARQDRRWRDLMALAQSGDRASYGTLLSEILPVLRRVVRARWPNASDAEDIVQDVLLSLHAVRHTYDPARPFMPWLMTLAHRRIADAARTLKRRTAQEQHGEDWHETFSAASANSHQRARDDREQLRKAMTELLPAQRQGIELVKIEGLSFEEASKVTGKSVPALKVSVHRAMKALRHILQRKS